MNLTTKLKRSLIYRIAPFIKDDAKYIKMRWDAYMDYSLHLDEPQTFNEKLQWLKLHDRCPQYTQMVDKAEVKKYVAAMVGEEHIIPTLAVYDRAEDIDFDALPNQFVLKCTHDSGGIVICRDKTALDKDEAVRKLNHGLRKNYYYQNREWPYKNVVPRIIAEQYMTNGDEDELTDYKIHNFNGVPKVVLVCKDRYRASELTEDFFSCTWQHLDIARPNHRHADKVPERPEELDEMLDIAIRLSRDIPFVRTDFYVINHKVYFGEMTFFPACGMNPFVPREWDYILGTYLTLPNNKNI